MPTKTITYVTDLFYQAKGRVYRDEDIQIIEYLKDYFNISIVNPKQLKAFLNPNNFFVFRNTGSVIHYFQYFRDCVEYIKENEVKTYNAFDGRGDMMGKTYLVELFAKGFPVIPTINNLTQKGQLENFSVFLTKPLFGADSIGITKVKAEDLENSFEDNHIVQPLVTFQYEVSFYFLDGVFQYALYAPDKQQRWKMEVYQPTKADLHFAQKFVDWNPMQWGIQRVDACRLMNDALLLVELEDLNPYLSLDLLTSKTRNQFLDSFKKALKKAMQTN